MKYVITESRLNNFITNWLESEYGDMEKFKHPGYEELFLSQEGMFKMSYISRTKRLYVKDNIWDFVREMFNLDNDETGQILKDWVNKKFGLRAKLAHRVEEV
jgi:hypothetical protein